MKRLINFAKSIIMLISLSFSMNVANCTANTFPCQLRVETEQEPMLAHLLVKISSNSPAVESVRIYRADSDIKEIQLFSLIQNTPAKNLEIHNGEISINDEITVAHTYSYYADIEFSGGVHTQTPIAVVTFEPSVEFTSEPVRFATRAQEYVYDADAVANNDGKVQFRLAADAPKGMTIDSETGIVRFFPTKDESFSYTILCNAVGFPASTSVQRVNVIMRTCQFGAVVSGNVREGTTATVGEGVVIFRRMSNGLAPFTVQTRIHNGAYKVQLDAGSYIASVQTGDKRNTVSEFTLDVSCGQSVVNNIVIPSSVADITTGKFVSQAKQKTMTNTQSESGFTANSSLVLSK